MYCMDNLDAFYEHESDQQRMLDRCPICCECDEPIQDEECFEIDGELICCDCLKANYLRYTEDFMKG